MKTINNLRILVIDDNPDIHKDFIKILMPSKNIGPASSEISMMEKQIFGEMSHHSSLPTFKIDTATQGKEGVGKIAKALKDKNPYSLAFVDIRMPPGWDGIETIKHIWELDETIQIVICTAYSDYTWEETVAQLGQRDNLLILKKPFDNIAVRQLASALTKKWKLVQETKEYTLSLEEELRYQATHDQLTGLPNRVVLVDSIKQAMIKADTDHSIFGVLFLDLDRFKLINDSLSHEAGDLALKKITKRLQSVMCQENTLFRLGGDEFIVVVNNIKDENDLRNFCRTLLNTFDESINIDLHEFTITTSIGASLYPRDGKTIDHLLRNADIAMHMAKELGVNQVQFFSYELNKKNAERLENEAAMRQGIAHNEFVLYYQPQFDLKSHKLVSVEALIRWQHPVKGILLPIDFISLAEETGLIIPIGEWVLRTACQQIKSWQDAGLPPIRVAVNITTKQFRLYNIVQVIAAILKETGLEAQYLELELTENIIINNIDMVQTIHDLKKMGIQIALDDFGTGYSSLSYLREIPVDRLKIDQSYIQNIDSRRGDDVLIQAIITMAKSLNLEVLAEGVETQRQVDFLMSKKCGEVQGFYFSKPISASECEKLLQNPENLALIIEKLP